MAFQFAHIQTYSRKGNKTNRSVAEICAEAGRVPGHHPHVAEALPPTLLAGDFLPEDVPEEIDRRIAEAKTRLKGKTRKTRMVIRDDTHVLEAQVYSHPVYVLPAPDEHTGEARPCLQNETDREAYLAWRNATVEFIYREGERRGLEVLSIVEHLDEAHPHVHALLVPTNPQLNAKHSHPGHGAAELAKAEAVKLGLPAAELNDAAKDALPTARAGRKGGDTAKPLGRNVSSQKGRNRKAVELTEGKILQRIGNRAYAGAMRGWQDTYHEEVGQDAGLLRVGPQRFRWSREEYMQRKQDARVVAEARKAARLAEERRVAAEETARRAREAIAPGSDFQAHIQQMTRDAVEEVEAKKAEEAAIETRLNAARQTIAGADEAVEAKKAEEAEIESRLDSARKTISAAEEAACLLEQRRAQGEELAKQIADRKALAAKLLEANLAAELRLSQLDDVENRMAETEEKLDAAKQAEAVALAVVSDIEQRAAAVADQEKAVADKRSELDGELAEAGRKLEEAEAKLAGLDAWRDGKLVVSDERLVITNRQNEALIDRLKPVRDWLHPALKSVEARIGNMIDSLVEAKVAERVDAARSSLLEAVEATVKVWASGALRRNSEGELKLFATKADVEVFRKVAVRPWRDLYKDLFAKLPSLAKISQAEKDAERLQAVLTDAEARHARNTQASFQKQRGTGFGSEGP